MNTIILVNSKRLKNIIGINLDDYNYSGKLHSYDTFFFASSCSMRCIPSKKISVFLFL